LHIDNAAKLDLWLPQEYTQTPQAANGPFGRIFDVQNVVANPLNNANSWSGSGIHGGDPGLQLWVNSTLTSGDDNSQLVHCSEIVLQRGDLLYGSFRISMKTSSVNGTCGAFFFYRDDTSEIDMEFLSKQQLPNNNNSVNLVIQSSENGGLGYTAPGSPDFAHISLSRNPSEAYVEYRFDWLPGHVDFFADDTLIKSMTDNIPSGPGRLHISHWSNGNPGWSAGPPQTDAVLTVSYVKAYFNSSEESIAAASMKNCPMNISATGACEIPSRGAVGDGEGGGEGGGRGGDGSGQTPFLTNSTDGKTHTSLATSVIIAPPGVVYVAAAAAAVGTVFVWLY
jgi:hypothetical protein